MEHRVKVTVLDKKLFPELQAQYCAVPDSGKCLCYSVGDEFMFYRNDERDDYWHMGAGTLIKSGKTDEGNPVRRTKAACNRREQRTAERRAFRSVPKRGMPSAATSTRRCKEGASCTVG